MNTLIRSIRRTRYIVIAIISIKLLKNSHRKKKVKYNLRMLENGISIRIILKRGQIIWLTF
jgi:hypothetical protein